MADDSSLEERALATALSIISGKWKALIVLRLLLHSRLRFGELAQLIPAISQRMLTTQLRELEGDGLLAREVFAEVPARVEYSLTPLGRSLQPVLQEMREFGERCLSWQQVQEEEPQT